MRLSRPCYDKPHRCPGWAGGGMRYAKVSRCDSGSLSDDMYARTAWKWRLNRCATCGVHVLPFVIRYLDPRWWSYAIRRACREITYRIQERRRG